MFENIRLALQGIWNHKLRSLLTMLGIIIGIASIITIVSTIKGTNDQIKQNLIGNGTNAVEIKLYQDDYEYDLTYSPLPEGVVPVSPETEQALREIDGVEKVSLYKARPYVDGTVFYQNTPFSGSLIGIDSNYLEIYGYALTLGRNFIERDFKEYRKSALIDQKAATALFPGENPIGKTIEISSEPFTVVGVVAIRDAFTPTINSMEDYWMYADTSSGRIFLPGTVWPMLYRFDEPECVVLKAGSTELMTSVGQAAAQILTQNQVLGSGSKFSYQSQDRLEQAKQLQNLSASTNRQLIWIAGISLLVGGIGVMNIMLVSVTERTREIGLKKALGAKRRRILSQFLTEASVLTSIGGIVGVAAGIIMAKAISAVMLTPTAVSIPAILIAVAFSIVIGILFGIIPAVKASKLNPIDALRRE